MQFKSELAYSKLESVFRVFHTSDISRKFIEDHQKAERFESNLDSSTFSFTDISWKRASFSDISQSLAINSICVRCYITSLISQLNSIKIDFKSAWIFNKLRLKISTFVTKRNSKFRIHLEVFKRNTFLDWSKQNNEFVQRRA